MRGVGKTEGLGFVSLGRAASYEERLATDLHKREADRAQKHISRDESIEGKTPS